MQFFSSQKDVQKLEIWNIRHYTLNGRETEIYALPANTTMMEIVIDEESVVVTHTFAKIYKKNIGDQVEIETTAGLITRRIKSVVTVFGAPALYITQNGLSDKEKSEFDLFVVIKYKSAGLKTNPRLSARLFTASIAQPSIRFQSHFMKRNHDF